ncbi:MAG: hypothetical protein ACC628_03065 [Pirellulaceae bacterium]
MSRFLIVQADFPSGRGTRGMNLYRFLAIYHGRKAVRLATTRELLASEPISTDTLFIGMPTEIGKEHLEKLKFRHVVLFDYHDGPGPIWRESDRDLLLTLTDTYLKPWVEPDWDRRLPDWDGRLKMGVLPIRRHYKLKFCLQCQDYFAWLRGRTAHRRKYDVAFIGNATTMESEFHQRIQWLREIREARDRYSFWGGIVVRKQLRESLERRFNDLEDLYYPRGRVDFFNYFRNLLRSRVALAPAGNARWSYRHYEAIYAGASLVSADFRETKILIPLPLDNMHHVADHATVLPAIDEALTVRRENPERATENIQFLERYLKHGDYCREKPELMDRFLAQLPKAA